MLKAASAGFGCALARLCTGKVTTAAVAACVGLGASAYCWGRPCARSA
jgi:hypothetical protein